LPGITKPPIITSKSSPTSPRVEMFVMRHLGMVDFVHFDEPYAGRASRRRRNDRRVRARREAHEDRPTRARFDGAKPLAFSAEAFAALPQLSLWRRPTCPTCAPA
jgi:hypothetical protein